MFAWLLLTLLAIVSAQTICGGALSQSDLATALVADIETISRAADLTVDTSVTATITTKDDFDAAVNIEFQSNIELTTDQQAAISAAVAARIQNITDNFPALQRDAILACLATKRVVIVGLLDTINSAVATALQNYFDAFQQYQANVRAYFDAWVALVAGADEVALITNQISFQTQRAITVTGNVAFYYQNVEQKLRQSWVTVADATVAYLTAIKNNVEVAAKRADLEAAVEASIILAIDLRRADALKDAVEAEVERIKDALDAQKVALRNAANRAWADIRAQLIASFQDVADKIEEHRRRLVDYLAGLQCDTSSASLAVVTDANNADAAVTIQLRGINCFNTSLSDDDFHGTFCAAVTAYFVSEQAAATVNTYACVVVNKKRVTEQTTSNAVAADMTASDQSTPPPTTSSSASFVACIVLLLVAFLFHF